MQGTTTKRTGMSVAKNTITKDVEAPDVRVRPTVAPPRTAATRPGAQHVTRFDVHQRIQHVLMFSSFLALAFTGLPQKFHTVQFSQDFIALLGGLEMTQHIHHIAAYVMIFDCIYHGVYMAHSLVVRRQLRALYMIPMPKDVLDAFQMFKYFLGFSNEKPQFGRFSYLEKFDYWAVFWGIAIIGGSGLLLLFPVQISQIVPGSIVPVALAAHSDEALLAVAWIFIVHFFYVHFAPAVFPSNTSIFTGCVSKERYAEEHPLEYQRLFAADEGGAQSVIPTQELATKSNQVDLAPAGSTGLTEPSAATPRLSGCTEDVGADRRVGPSAGEARSETVTTSEVAIHAAPSSADVRGSEDSRTPDVPSAPECSAPQSAPFHASETSIDDQATDDAARSDAPSGRTILDEANRAAEDIPSDQTPLATKPERES